MDDSSEILIDGNAATTMQHRNQTQNQIERHRRLIPYMTFYLPATNNDLKLPINQAYNFMPAPSGPAAMYHAMQQQQQQQQMIQPQKIRGLIAVPVSPPMPMHHALQHQPKPIVYLTGKFQVPNGITRPPSQQQYVPMKTTMEPPIMSQGQGFSNIKFPTYLSQQPQSGVITQNYYQAQSHKMPPVMPPPQTIKHHHQTQSSSQSSSVIQKVNFTPFLPSNKLPGHFVPIQTPIQHNSYGSSNHDENNNNNFVYQNHGASQFNSGGGGGSVIENSLILSNNNQNYNNDQKLSSGKPVVANIFVTSTPRAVLSPDGYKKYNGVSKGVYQTPANVFYSTPAPKLLGQDLPFEHVKYNGNKFGKSNLIFKEIVTPKPQSVVKYTMKDEKPYYKPSFSSNSDYGRIKGNDYIQVTPILVTTVAPVLVTTLSASNHKYRPQYIPLKEDDIARPSAPEKPYYPPSSTMSPIFVPKFINTTPAPPAHNPSTYHPTIKTYYVPSPNQVKYVTPVVKPTEDYHTTTTTTTTTPRPYKTVTITPGTDDDLDGNSLATLLRKLQETNHLPETLTPDNIDNSIRTLVKILNNLKKSKDRYKVTPAPEVSDYDYKYYDDNLDVEKPAFTGPHGPNTGKPGVDYPNYSEIPETSFSCKEQRYKGFFGDPETSCQVWHYCDLNGGKASFLCPNGTIFSQVALTCDWWFNVKCSNTAQQYVLNERLYKYILPFTPKFPEDYSGPLVDKYLALKFEEMEEKLRRQKEKGLHKQHENEDEPNTVDENSSNSSSEEESSTETPSLTVTESDAEEILGTNVISSAAPLISNLISTTTPMPPYRYLARHQNHHVPSSLAATATSPHPKTIVESERLHVIEIKTDGSTGHLVRSTTGGGDYVSE